MTGQQLKNSILQMAVQGKLVPQDPNDEPASVLIERIREEKQRLIKEGKIKKEKNPSYIFRGEDNMPYEKIGNNEPVCIADEVPFDIPESWEWVRLGQCSTYSCSKEKISAKDITPEMWSLDLEDIEKETGKILRYTVASERKITGDKVIFHKQQILYSKLRPYLKKILIAPDDGIATPELVPFDLLGEILPEYMLYVLKCPHIDYVINTVTYGVKMPRVGTDTMTNLLIPLPPLNEQKRIIQKINAVIPIISLYGKTQEELDSYNTTFPELLKKSILQTAIQGKLVEQNLNDEPAYNLLQKINAEKDNLIKAGKIKKDKNESTIFRRDNSYYEKIGNEERCIDDEIPFDIPEHWEWIRLNDIGIYKKGPFGSALTKSMFVPKGNDTIKVYEQKNAIQKNHRLGEYYITKLYYEEKMQGFTVEPGNIIVSCAGTIGETYILPDDIELGIINQALMKMDIFAPINIDYFLLYFDYVIKQSARENSKGSAIKNIPPFSIFKQMLLPLPPIEEQDRIVKSIELLFNTVKLYSDITNQ